MLGAPKSERGPLRGWSLAILGALERRQDRRELPTPPRCIHRRKLVEFDAQTALNLPLANHLHSGPPIGAMERA
jgi:hypothetical protein